MAFVKKEKLREGVKILAYGESGSGKTPFVLTFPGLALADADSSSTFYKDDCDNIVSITNSGSVKVITEELDELESDEEMFSQVKSLGVDSISRLYENLQHAALKVVEQRARKNARMVEGEGLSQKEWGVIKLHYDRFNSKLAYFAKRGINVIVVAEGKDKQEAVKQTDGSFVYVKVGTTYNSSKGAEFDFDIVLEFSRDGKGGSIAKVIKDRTKTYMPDDTIEMASYENWKEAIEKAQSGRQRTKEEIKNIDSDIDKDVDAFNAVEDEGKKIKAIASEIKKVASAKLKEGISKAQIEKTAGKTLNFETTEQAQAVLDKLNALSK